MPHLGSTNKDEQQKRELDKRNSLTTAAKLNYPITLSLNILQKKSQNHKNWHHNNTLKRNVILLLNCPCYLKHIWKALPQRKCKGKSDEKADVNILSRLVSHGYFGGVLSGHPFSTYTKFSENLTFLTTWYTHVRVRNVSFRKILPTYLMNDPLEPYQRSKIRLSAVNYFRQTLHLRCLTGFWVHHFTLKWLK